MDKENKNNEEIDLSGALKDMKFKEYRTPRLYYPGTPKIIKWVIKYSGGLIKDEKQASYVLFGFLIIAIVIILFLLFNSGPDIKPSIPSPEFNPLET